MMTFDYYPLIAVPIAAEVIAVTEVASVTVVVAELGACATEVVTITEVAAVTVAADANANSKILGAGYGRRRHRNSRKGCKRKTKLSHVPSSLSCPMENGRADTLFQG
jgi:hypothetical protein